MTREKIIELIGYRFGALVSGNNQPHMSGDPRARIVGERRRHFDDACADCADEILKAFAVGDNQQLKQEG